MMGNRRKLGIVLAALMIAMVGLVSWAEEPSGSLRAEEGDWMLMLREQRRPLLRQLVSDRLEKLAELREELDLTEAQREQSREVVAKWRGDIAPAVDAVVEKKRALKAEVLVESPDESAIRQAAAEVGEELGNAALLASGFVCEARTLLSPEQLEHLRDFCASREEKWEEGMARLREWLAAN